MDEKGDVFEDRVFSTDCGSIPFIEESRPANKK